LIFDMAARIDDLFGGRIPERASRRHGDNAVAADADVAVRPWIPSAVDDLAVHDHDVIAAAVRPGRAAGGRVCTAGEDE
jgi:hypothetical protein